MVENESGISDLVNEDDFKFLRQNLGNWDINNIVNSDQGLEDLPGSEHLPAMVMDIMNSDNSNPEMEELKYIDPNGYLQEYPTYPPAEPTDVCNKDFSGEFGFEVFVDPNGIKSSWEYSPSLNKLYIDMKYKFPINFSVIRRPIDQQFFIRVIPIYEEDRYCQDIVHRCICHELPQDTTNIGIPLHIIQHIIRCDNDKAHYFGDRATSKRLNMVIPLSHPQAGTDSIKEMFNFVCKNSCVGGMNRRPIQIIFALENEYGDVLGRKVLCVRICSCPKRDREKDESKKGKHSDPPGKKRKLEKKVASSTETAPGSTKMIPITMYLPGEEHYKHFSLQYYNVIAAELFKQAEKGNGNDPTLRKYLQEAQSMMNKFQE